MEMHASSAGYSFRDSPPPAKTETARRRRLRVRPPVSKINGFGLAEMGFNGPSGADILDMSAPEALAQIAPIFTALAAAHTLSPVAYEHISDMVNRAMRILHKSSKPIITTRNYRGKVWGNLPSHLTDDAIASITNFLPEDMCLPSKLTESQIEELHFFQRSNGETIFHDLFKEMLPESTPPGDKSELFQGATSTLSTALRLAEIRHKTWKHLSSMTVDGRKAFSSVSIDLHYEDQDRAFSPERNMIHNDQGSVIRRTMIDEDGNMSRKEAHALDALRFMVAVSDTTATIIPDCDLPWGKDFLYGSASEMEVPVNISFMNTQRDYYKVSDPSEERECPDRGELEKLARDAPVMYAGEAVGGMLHLEPHAAPLRNIGDVWMIVTLFPADAPGARESYPLTTKKALEIFMNSDFFKKREDDKSWLDEWADYGWGF